MAEITSSAYDAIRYYIQEHWIYVELYDEDDERILSRTTSHADVNWIHPTKNIIVSWDSYGNPIYDDVPDTNLLQLEIVVKGSEVTLPRIFAKSVIKGDFEGSYSEEEFEPFTMTQEDDEITIVHNIEVPKVE